MKPKLFELGVMLNHQLPILVSFVMMRLLGVFTVQRTLGALVPTRVQPYYTKAGELFSRVRQVAMTLGIANLVFQTAYAPPSGVCDDYENIRSQGTSALMALSVLLASNSALGSAVAIGALRAVASTSPASLVLSTSAVVIASSTGSTVLYTYALFWTALAHAVWCNSNAHPTRTHGSLIAVIAIMMNVLLYLAAFAYRRVVLINTKLIRALADAARLLIALRHAPHGERRARKRALTDPVTPRPSPVTTPPRNPSPLALEQRVATTTFDE